MRIPTRRIWRAFPELDHYDDTDCRRFVGLARQKAKRRWLHAFLVFFVLVAGVVLSLLAIAAVAAATGGLMSRASDAAVMTGFMFAAVATIAVPSMTALAVRDFFLRRRVREVLRDSGTCPQCGYSLIGLVIPESLRVPCPECGFPCVVDASLAALTKGDGAGVMRDGVRVISARPPRWTPEQQRRRRRRALLMASLVVLLLAVLATLFEISVQRRAAQARAGAPTAADITAAIERHWPGVPRVEMPRAHTIIEVVAVRTGEIEAEVPVERRQRSNFMWSFDSVLAPSDALTGETEDEAAFVDVAEEMLRRFESAGVFEELASIRSVPDQVRDFRVAPAQLVGIVLPYLRAAQSHARFLAARMRVSAMNDEISKAEESLEVMLAISRACTRQALLIEHLIGSSIDIYAAENTMAWLQSQPTAEAVDAIERAWGHRDAVERMPLAIEVEAIWTRTMAAMVLGSPGTLRLAPVIGAAMPFARMGGSNIRAPGSWEGNRRAIDQMATAFSERAILDHYQVARGDAPTPMPSFEGAAMAERLSFFPPRILDTVNSRRAADRTIRLMIALERHRLARGAYPASVDELVPGFMPQVPIDPWSGKPLGYRRVDRSSDPFGRPYLIYSLGPDGSDDGGAEGIDITEIGRVQRPRRPDEATPGSDVQLNKVEPLMHRPGAMRRR